MGFHTHLNVSIYYFFQINDFTISYFRLLSGNSSSGNGQLCTEPFCTIDTHFSAGF